MGSERPFYPSWAWKKRWDFNIKFEKKPSKIVLEGLEDVLGVGVKKKNDKTPLCILCICYLKMQMLTSYCFERNE